MSTLKNSTNVPVTPSQQIPNVGDLDNSCQDIASAMYRIKFAIFDNPNLTTAAVTELSYEYLQLAIKIRQLQQQSWDLVEAVRQTTEECLSEVVQ